MKFNNFQWDVLIFKNIPLVCYICFYSRTYSSPILLTVIETPVWKQRPRSHPSSPRAFKSYTKWINYSDNFLSFSQSFIACMQAYAAHYCLIWMAEKYLSCFLFVWEIWWIENINLLIMTQMKLDRPCNRILKLTFAMQLKIHSFVTKITKHQFSRMY